MSRIPPAYGQIVPPHIKNLLIRPRLHHLGQQLLSHPITTVVAPAGYGKSVWVSSLLEEQDWPLTAWLNLEQRDGEPSNLLYHLIHAVKRVVPAFGTESLRTLTSLENLTRDWPVAVTAFLAELPLDRELVLVLDDVHLIHENEAACAILDRILRWLPDHIHLVLISRSNLPLKLYRQELNENLLEIRGSQLLFGIEEARSLFSLMGLTLTEEEIAAVHAWTEGWAVGLRLAGIYMKQSGDQPDKVIRASRQEDSRLYQYLSNELLATLPAHLKDFLLNSSLLPYLEAELCQAAFLCTDSLGMLEQLHRYGLLSRVEGRPVTWRIHHLIGAYLADRAGELLSPAYIGTVHSRAGAFFEQKGDIDRAIEQAVICADWPRAAHLIHHYGYDYFTGTGRLDGLFKWIGQLPEKLVAGDHWLLYYKGKSMMQIDDVEAITILSASMDCAVEKEDVKCEACCLLAMISSSVFSGDYKKGKELGRRLLAKPSLLTDPRSRGAALTAALWNAMYTDDLPQGLKLSRLALRLELNPEFKMNVLYMSAFIHYRLGNLSYARQLIEEALDMPFVQENERCLITGYTILILVVNFSEDHTSFEEICRQILRIGEKYHMPIHTGRVYLNLGYKNTRAGNFMEARRNFALTYDYFMAGGGTSIAIQAALLNMLPRIRTGENAGELLQETENLLARFQAFPYGQGIDYYTFTLGGIVALEAGELDLARQWFEKSAGRWRQNEAKQNLAATNLLLAHVHLLQGDEKAADSLLGQALGTAEAGQWVNFWEWNDETVYTMCRRAVLKNIHINWAVRLLSRWFPLRSRRELGCLLLSPHKQQRACAVSLFQDRAREEGMTVIYAFFLGGFRLFINGWEIDKKEWKTRRAEKLVKCLLADRRDHTKEELIEQLWPGSDLPAGDASLRTTLNYVRKVLAGSGADEDSVVLRRGKVYLNPRMEVYCDYEFFTAEVQQAVHYLETGSPYGVIALDQAVRLYRGTFLPEDVYEDWANPIRNQLYRRYLDALLKLAHAHYAQNNLTAALEACRQYLAAEPVDEPVVRLAMEILGQAGKRQKALSMYHELAVTMERDYDTVPEPETVKLYHLIRNGSE